MLATRTVATVALMVAAIEAVSTYVNAQVSCGVAWSLRSDTGLPPRANHALAYDEARNRTVLFGGSQGSVALGDTWEWDGSVWTQRTPVHSPQARSRHAMVFDNARNRVVLFGGDTVAGQLADTWEFDGVDWELVSTTGPLIESGTNMAFDSARNVTVLFGAGTNRRETWIWDGLTWSQKLPVTAPLGSGPMAFDALRGRIVMNSGGPTWEWDGADWSPKQHLGVGCGLFAPGVMTYDSNRRVCLLVRTILIPSTNGACEGNIANDLWEWDGVGWTQRSWNVAGDGPVSRFGEALSFDALRSRAVMTGGVSVSYGGALRDTWELDPSDIPTISSQSSSQSLFTGQKAAFFVIAGSNGTGGPITYHWRRNGALLTCGGRISGCGSPVLTIDPVDPSDAGAYDVVVSTACGSVTSSPMPLSLGCRTDYDRNGIIQPADIGSFVSAWFASLSGGCPP